MQIPLLMPKSGQSAELNQPDGLTVPSVLKESGEDFAALLSIEGDVAEQSLQTPESPARWNVVLPPGAQPNQNLVPVSELTLKDRSAVLSFYADTLQNSKTASLKSTQDLMDETPLPKGETGDKFRPKEGEIKAAVTLAKQQGAVASENTRNVESQQPEISPLNVEKPIQPGRGPMVELPDGMEQSSNASEISKAIVLKTVGKGIDERFDTAIKTTGSDPVAATVSKPQERILRGQVNELQSTEIGRPDPSKTDGPSDAKAMQSDGLERTVLQTAENMLSGGTTAERTHAGKPDVERQPSLSTLTKPTAGSERDGKQNVSKKPTLPAPAVAAHNLSETVTKDVTSRVEDKAASELPPEIRKSAVAVATETIAPKNQLLATSKNELMPNPIGEVMSGLKSDETAPLLSSVADIPRAATSASIGTPSLHATVSQMPVQPIAAQIALAAHATAQGQTEIRLDPEELGSVRIILSSKDTGMVVVIAAERPETLDLMRRNAHELSASFEDLGYSDTSFSFEQQTQDEHPSPEQGRTVNTVQHRDAIAPGTTLITLQSEGMDLRV